MVLYLGYIIRLLGNKILVHGQADTKTYKQKVGQPDGHTDR